MSFLFIFRWTIKVTGRIGPYRPENRPFCYLRFKELQDTGSVSFAKNEPRELFASVELAELVLNVTR